MILILNTERGAEHCVHSAAVADPFGLGVVHAAYTQKKRGGMKEMSKPLRV